MAVSIDAYRDRDRTNDCRLRYRSVVSSGRAFRPGSRQLDLALSGCPDGGRKMAWPFGLRVQETLSAEESGGSRSGGQYRIWGRSYPGFGSNLDTDSEPGILSFGRTIDVSAGNERPSLAGHAQGAGDEPRKIRAAVARPWD